MIYNLQTFLASASNSVPHPIFSIQACPRVLYVSISITSSYPCLGLYKAWKNITPCILAAHTHSVTYTMFIPILGLNSFIIPPRSLPRPTPSPTPKPWLDAFSIFQNPLWLLAIYNPSNPRRFWYKVRGLISWKKFLPLMLPLFPLIELEYL